MQKIKVGRSRFATVDDEDADKLSVFSWFFNGRYAYSKAGLMHRLVLVANPGREVDHINGDGLDNRKCNLRICTRAQNSRNRKTHKNNKLRVKGVYFDKVDKRYRAQIRVNGIKICLGSFRTVEEASNMYASWAKHYHGEFART